MGPIGGVACYSVDRGQRRRQPQRLYSTIFCPTTVDPALCVGFRNDDCTLVPVRLWSHQPPDMEEQAEAIRPFYGSFHLNCHRVECPSRAASCCLVFTRSSFAVRRSPFSLPTLPTLPEKFQRMANLGKPVLLFDLALNSLYWTRIDHDSHPSAFGADDMVAMALRVD